jgi:putative FmdB family regulatory protein
MRTSIEQFQSMKEEPLKECPVCQKDSLVRLVSGGAGLIFKGSGFISPITRIRTPRVPTQW